MTLEPGIERTEEFTAEGSLLTDVRSSALTSRCATASGRSALAHTSAA